MAKLVDHGRARRSFGHAIRGLTHVVKNEQNLRIHVAAASGVILLALVLRLTTIELATLFLAIGLVITAEVINTVIEDLLDIIHPNHHPMVGRIKDTLAGAVLLAAVVSAVIGVLIFWPHLFAASR